MSATSPFARVKSIVRSYSLLAGLISVACFQLDVDLPDCTQPCSSDCPSSYECRNGYCAREDSPNQCTVTQGTGGLATGGSLGSSGGGAGTDSNGGTTGGSSASESGGSPASGGTSSVEGGAQSAGDSGNASASGQAGRSFGGSNSGGAGGSDDASGGDPPGGGGGEPDAGGGGEPDGGRGTPLAIKYSGPGASPPEPCSGVPFDIAIEVAGGTPPYDWQFTSAPSGLSFDPETRLLSGAITSTTTATLKVTDAADGDVQGVFTFAPRSACWLAYLSEASGQAKLKFFDPVLSSRRVLSDNAAGEAASDFRFSPDGRHIAFRLKSSSGSYRISVRSAPDWVEEIGPIEGAVEHYAWAPDSSALAIGFLAGGDTWLGGVDYSSGRAVELVATKADLVSDLVWFGDGLLGFLGLGEEQDPEIRVPYATRLDGDHFVNPTSVEIPWLSSRAVLEGGRPGLFAVDASSGVRTIVYYDYTGLETTDEPIETLFSGEYILAPSALFAAKVGATGLGVFDLSPKRPQLAIASNQDCTHVLAWASASERFACLAMPATGNEVRVLNLSLEGQDPASRLSSRTLRGTIDYPEAASIFLRRAFAPSGNWLAFATDSQLYVGKLADAQPWLARSDGLLGLPADDPARELIELAFAPNEKFALQHRGAQLSYHSLASPTEPARVVQAVGEALPAPNPCAPAFLDNPHNWCGSVSGPSPAFVLSPDSRFVAFRNTNGELRMKELFVPFGSAQTVPVDTGCRATCAPTFQP